jgi:hypothetical protein
MVPVESARAVVKAFADAKKQNLTSREYPKLDHRWSDPDGRGHFEEVARELLEWVKGLALVPPRSAIRARSLALGVVVASTRPLLLP